MKYPSNFKAFAVDQVRAGCICECSNKCLVTITEIREDVIIGNVTFMPEALKRLRHNAEYEALWDRSGAKMKAHKWPPHMNLAKIL